MRVLICGDRWWARLRATFEEPTLTETLLASEQDRLIVEFIGSLPPDSIIIEGGAQGADRHARQAALSCGLIVETFNANWEAYGRAAGPIRNKKMLTEGKPDLVVAFHPFLAGSKGTKNMVSIARDAGVPVLAVQTRDVWELLI
jgi:hypothetical protein